ncbi:hypothetical protein MHK_009174 [Candidatus Magnetomorum sp. HK-1]|nr:hypothetical protein MHK_009174 [Candidatus Magnetomorum sp. HK-1]
MIREYILNSSEIMLVFNALTKLGLEKNLKIQIPMMNDMTVFSFNLNPESVKIKHFIDINDYSKFYYSLSKQLKGREQKEIPDYHMVSSVLYQAGLLKPGGIDKLDSLIDSIRCSDILRGGDVYYIALDTNLLRDRFYSVYLSKIPFHQNLDFVLCDTVREELKNRHDKIKKQKFKDMRPIPYELLDTCFFNQNSLEDRLRYIGFLEYNEMRSKTSCEEIEAKAKKNGMLNDREIINAYSEFVDVGKKIIFISRDNEIVRMMTGEDNVIPIILEHKPSRRKNFSIQWEQFFDLLYTLGVLFGKLHIVTGKTKVADIYGVWKGKDVKEWETGRFKVCLQKPDSKMKEDFEDYQFIIKDMNKNLSILSQLLNSI